MTEQEIIDNLTKICLCTGVSKKTIKKAIENGADTVEKVWKETGSGRGSCGGRRCGPRIQAMLDDYRQ